MVSTHQPTSKSSSPFNNLLVTVPNAPITTGIIVTSMFHDFFNSLARSRHLSFFSHSFSFILWSAGTAKVDNFASSLFWLIYWPHDMMMIMSCLLGEIRWSVRKSKSHRSLCVVFLGRCWVEPIEFVCMVEFKFLAHLPVDDHLDNPFVSSLILLLW